MSTIVTRAGKGSALTHNEVDANFTNLNTDKIQSGNTVASLTVTSISGTTATYTNAIISSATISGGTITGITDLAVADGGTGASDASGARTNLGLGTIATQDSSNVSITGGTINGTTVGATTPSTGSFTSLTDSGNLTFTGTGNRITGDFSNATLANRVAFQTSTVNSGTYIETLPNGTSQGSGVIVFNNSDPTNAAFMALTADASTAQVNASITGTGTYLPMTFRTGGSERMRVDTSGNVGIGTSSPGARLEVKGASATAGQLSIHDGTGDTTVSGVTAASLLFQARDSSVRTIAEIDAVNTTTNGTGGAMVFQTRISDTLAERMRIDSSGNVGIGTSSPATKFHVVGSSLVTTTSFFGDTNYYSALSGSNPILGFDANDYILYDRTNNFLQTVIGGTERARIDSSGNLLVGTTNVDPAGTGTNANGIAISPNSYISMTRTSAAPLNVNRKSTDGDVVTIRQDGTTEGTISVSGTTVSYNAFAGSHWSQLQDGSKPEILRGTVMESIDELCQWPDEPTSERLCRSKISDTAGSKRVYGVFMDWDNDWTATNDMLVTSLGAFICRINAGVTVQMGDLLESNGDGTARVQSDDIIRSSTIGKVTSTIKAHEYDDGSYCVPTVLYCG